MITPAKPTISRADAYRIARSHGVNPGRLLSAPGTNSKLAKGDGAQYLTASLFMAPATRAGGPNLCPFADDHCVALCLNESGRAMVFPEIDRARIRKARFYHADRDAFLVVLAHNIRLHVERTRARGATAAIRLNGTTDILWERIAPWLFLEFPDVTFYDYTKVPNRRALPANYTLTFSRSATNSHHVASEMSAGRNVAVVFATRRHAPLPATFAGRPVIDGDLSDLRFTDPAGSVVGLRAKGHAIGDASGFVVPVELAAIAA